MGHSVEADISRLILSKLADNGKLIAIDRDPKAVAEAKKIQDPRFSH